MQFACHANYVDSHGRAKSVKHGAEGCQNARHVCAYALRAYIVVFLVSGVEHDGEGVRCGLVSFPNSGEGT